MPLKFGLMQPHDISKLPADTSVQMCAVPSCPPLHRLNASIWPTCGQNGITHLLSIDTTALDEDTCMGVARELTRVATLEPDAFIFAVPDGSNRPVSKSLHARWLSWRIDRWVRLLTACPVKHTSSQCWVMPVQLCSQLKSPQTGAAFVLDMMVQSAWGGMSLIEVPLPIVPPRPKYGLWGYRLRRLIRWLFILPIRPKRLIEDE